MVTQTVKNLPATKETRVGSLGQEDSPEKEMATPSTILAWSVPWTEEPGTHEVEKRQTQLSNQHFHFHSVFGRKNSSDSMKFTHMHTLSIHEQET